MVTLTALRPLSGKYGIVHQGGTFQVDEETAEALEARGLAEQFRTKYPKFDPNSFKMSLPPQNKMIDLKVSGNNKRR